REMGSRRESLEAAISDIRKGLPGPDLAPMAPVSGRGMPPFAFSFRSAAEVESGLDQFRGGFYRGVKIFDLPTDLFSRLVSESKRSGLITSCHIDRISPLFAIRTGVDSLEHIYFLI